MGMVSINQCDTLSMYNL